MLVEGVEEGVDDREEDEECKTGIDESKVTWRCLSLNFGEEEGEGDDGDGEVEEESVGISGR